MKQPKRLNPKKTAIFYQKAFDQYDSLCYGARLRLLFPNGKSKWFNTSLNERWFYSNNKWKNPCWYSSRSIKNRKDALKEMRKFDKKECWQPAVFIGYLEDWGK